MVGRTFAAATIAALLFAAPASAGPRADALAACTAAKTTSADRLLLVRWIGGAISAHPANAPASRLTDADREKIAAETAELFQRLLVQDCRSEAAETLVHEGLSGMSGSFEALGKLAMQEVMGEPNVARELSRVTDKFDEAKFQAFQDEVLKASRKASQ